MEHTINIDNIAANITSYGETNTIGYVQTADATLYNSWICSCYHVKSAREKVIDEILTKMADAVFKEDFKTAKVLAQLAKSVKEL